MGDVERSYAKDERGQLQYKLLSSLQHGYRDLKVEYVHPVIVDACLFTLDMFFLFSAERRLNQETILKVITDSTID